MKDGRGRRRSPAQSVLALALDQVLRLFHPFVPFITEVLWERLNAQCPARGLKSPIRGSELLIAAAWPEPKPMWEDEGIEAEFALARDVVRAIRESRAQHALPPSKKLAAVAKAQGRSSGILTDMSALIGHMAGLESLEIAADAARPESAVSRRGRRRRDLSRRRHRPGQGARAAAGEEGQARRGRRRKPRRASRTRDSSVAPRPTWSRKSARSCGSSGPRSISSTPTSTAL